MIDKEGHDVARFLSSIGVVGVVLKYRTSPIADRDTQLRDVQRAIRIVRSRAGKLGVRPDRVGVMGFSAGGWLTVAAATRFDTGKPDAPDPLDRLSCRPDFAVPVYAVYPKGFEQAVATEAPPAFIVHADDDRLPAADAARFYVALKAAKVPAELHIYATGGHGFGLGIHGGPVAAWPQALAAWLAGRNADGRSPTEAHRGLGPQPGT